MPFPEVIGLLQFHALEGLLSISEINLLLSLYKPSILQVEKLTF